MKLVVVCKYFELWVGHLIGERLAAGMQSVFLGVLVGKQVLQHTRYLPQ